LSPEGGTLTAQGRQPWEGIQQKKPSPVGAAPHKNDDCKNKLLVGYSAMRADSDREVEATQWCEAMIRDAYVNESEDPGRDQTGRK
jgi:hypothetical protein